MFSRYKELRVVLVLNELVTGGAEIFTLRLAADLQKRGLQVILLTLRGEASEPELLPIHWPSSHAIHYKHPCLLAILKVDGVLKRLGLDQSLLSLFQIRFTRRVLARLRPDVVHSHLFSTDLVVLKALDGFSIPWVSTVHGDYLQFARYSCKRGNLMRNFRARCRQIDQRINQLILISEPQKQVMAELMPISHQRGLHQIIPNGIPLKTSSLEPDLFKRQHRIQLGLRADSFLIGMVARGIEEKGWDVLIRAFEVARLTDAELLLVGEGPALRKLAKRYLNLNIHFYGPSSDPQALLRLCDLSCLPSRYSSESCPLVIVESLAVGVPVLATRVGQISWMIDEGSEHPAGYTLPLEIPEKLSIALASILGALEKSPQELRIWQQNCVTACKKFSIERCSDAYLEAYRAAGV